jgi:hypothetical protein
LKHAKGLVATLPEVKQGKNIWLDFSGCSTNQIFTKSNSLEAKL